MSRALVDGWKSTRGRAFWPEPKVAELQRQVNPVEQCGLWDDDKLTIERELKAKLQEWMILERDFVPLPVPPNQ